MEDTARSLRDQRPRCARTDSASRGDDLCDSRVESLQSYENFYRCNVCSRVPADPTTQPRAARGEKDYRDRLGQSFAGLYPAAHRGDGEAAFRWTGHQPDRKWNARSAKATRPATCVRGKSLWE